MRGGSSARVQAAMLPALQTVSRACLFALRLVENKASDGIRSQR
jgi:hypothetical protein